MPPPADPPRCEPALAFASPSTAPSGELDAADEQLRLAIAADRTTCVEYLACYQLAMVALQRGSGGSVAGDFKEWLDQAGPLDATKTEQLSLNMHYLAAGREEEAPGLIAALVAAGASLSVVDDKGWAPILSAANFGSESAIAALIDAGADVSANGSSGESALHLACMSDNGRAGAIIQRLVVAHPPLLQATDTAGNTALHVAAMLDHLDAAQALLAAGADAEATNHAGRTVREEARGKGRVSQALS